MARKGVCEECGDFTNKLCVHHRDRNHSNNDEENLKYLCVSCHTSEHSAEMCNAKDKSFDLVDEISDKRAGFRLIHGNEILDETTTDEVGWILH